MRAVLILSVALAMLGGRAHAQPCVGDCDGDGVVSIDELVLGVQIALGTAPVARCNAADRDGNDTVMVEELIAAVDAALGGCNASDCVPAPGAAPTTVLVTAGLSRPTSLVAAPGDRRRLFVVEQPGRIRIIRDGTLVAEPFLSIPERVSCCGERGLLGLAFPPDHASSRRFFVNYTDPGGNTVIARYRLSADDRADRDSEQVVLRIQQPFNNHNGGQLAFGPDGYLYVGMGDGGSGGDPANNAQNDDTLLGKLLRLDVAVPDDAPVPYAVPPDNPRADRGAPLGLIWAKGLRNPWRFSFDRETGDLYIADVGQGSREEINVQPAGSRGGENYGWRIFEGLACFNPSPQADCPDPPIGLVMPVVDYDHSGGRCSVTGGYVYRGCALPDLRGHYLFADFCARFLQSFVLAGGVATDIRDRAAELAPAGGGSIDQVSTFGEDADGEIYIADYADGELYKIVPASR